MSQNASITKHTTMKRIFHFNCFILLLFIIPACGTNDKNVKVVEKEFRHYVQKTFDNPKDLKEVVEVLPSDTLSVIKLGNMLQMAYETCEMSRLASQKQDSIEKEIFNANLYDVRKVQKMDYPTRLKVTSIINTMMELTSKDLSLKKEVLLCEQPIMNLKDSLHYEAPIYEYAINYRVKQGEGLKLKTEYAYIDSLKGFLKIMPERMTDEDYSEQYRKALSLITTAMVNTKKLSAITTQRKENTDEFESVTLSYTK